MVEGVEHLHAGLEIVFIVAPETSVLGDLQIQILVAGLVDADCAWRIADLKWERHGVDGWVEPEFSGLARQFGVVPDQSGRCPNPPYAD